MVKNIWKWKTHIKFTCRNERMVEIKSFPFPFSLNSRQNEIKSKWKPKWNKTMKIKIILKVTYSIWKTSSEGVIKSILCFLSLGTLVEMIWITSGFQVEEN